MKRIIYFMLIAIFALTLPFCANAEGYDGAGLLDYDEDSAISARTLELTEKYDCMVVVYTADSLDGYYSAETAAKNTLQYYIDGYYNDFSNGGVIFYVAMESRDWWVYTTGNAWDMFNSDAMDEIEERAVEYLSDGEYYKAFDTYLDIAEDVLEANANGNAYKRPKDMFDLVIYIGIAAVIALVIAFIWVSILRSQLTSVRFKHGADDYRVAGSFNVTGSADRFLYKNVTRTAIPKSSGSSGGSRGGGGGSRGGKF